MMPAAVRTALLLSVALLVPAAGESAASSSLRGPAP
eukprot:CAMPEP_0116956538 /NCGR_PEP_ID=MMETSP0467-20121206/43393_1 /TAXON_ID=283647 /ORGANISM="Mesodinium pulex, Strain SPMC105" /LENGTH=35 /DNA_ID= /DNA_START= /DNA_END= /DNA_ORIENTATION=